MKTIRECLTNAFINAFDESVDSSKEMIQQNVVPSFDDMGMAHVTPGEFAQDEITDKQNLVNTAEMSNDTDFEGKASNEENAVDAMVNAAEEVMKDIVDISGDSCPCEDDKHDDKEEVEKMHVLEFGESYLGKIIDKTLGGKTCEQWLQALNESNYAGPRDWNPDTRINTADVLTTLKREIGDGAEAIHVDQIYDDQHNDAYKVSQIDKDLLPKKIQVETTMLELDDNGVYHINKISDTYPLPK